MNDSYERSYYEIALTNSQVLSALAILLLCLLASFVAGMWVAREAVTPAPVRAAEAVTEELAPPEGGEAEFRFFRRLGNRAEKDVAVGPAGVAVSTPTDGAKSGSSGLPGGGEARSEGVVRKVSPVEVAAQVPAKKPQIQQRTPEPESLPTEPQRQAKAVVEPPATNKEPEQAPASPPAKAVEDERKLGTMVVVQVLSSADQEKAGKVVVQLKDSGYRAFLSPALVEGRTMYRVRVGPYADRAQAEQASEKIKSQFRLNTWITVRG